MKSAAADAIAIRRTVACNFDDAIDKVTTTLKEQGFGVLTEIDVQATLKEKIGVAFRRYHILGACNPPFAHKALSSELRVGLMMPCNVVVYEKDDGDIELMGFNPEAMLGAFGRDELRDIAVEIRDRMQKAIDAV